MKVKKNDMADEMSTWELAKCVKINLDHLSEMSRQVAKHPMYWLAYEQLKTLIDRLHKEAKGA